MVKIKIIAVPPGQAPKKFREKWVGLELPVKRVNWKVPVRIEDGMLLPAQPGYTLYYPVDTEVAIRELQKVDPEAAQWFRDNLRKGFQELFFPDFACQVSMDW